MSSHFTLGTMGFLLLICLAGVASAADSDPWTAPPEAAAIKNPFESSPAVLAKGKKIFDIQCFVCHGTKGKGDGPAAAAMQQQLPDFTDPGMADKTDGEQFWKITTGRAPMLAFGDMYSEEDRWSLVHYIRAFVIDTKEGSK